MGLALLFYDWNLFETDLLNIYLFLKNNNLLHLLSIDERQEDCFYSRFIEFCSFLDKKNLYNK